MIFERFVLGPLSTNCYLFGDKVAGEVVVIDPEVGAWSKLKCLLRRRRIPQSQALRAKLWEGEELSPGAFRAGLFSCGGFKLKAILATHGHFDHIGGVCELQEKAGAPFLISEEAKEELTQSQKIARELFGLDSPTPPRPDGYFKDGDKIKVGRYSLEVIHTPGHSPGSTCFYVRLGELLPERCGWSGLVSNSGIGNPKFEYLNPKQTLNSNVQNSKRFGNLDFGHLDLFRISDLVLRVFKPRRILEQARSDGEGRFSGILFSGDLLFKNGIGRTDLSGGDSAQLKGSLRKIATLPYPTRVLPGHGPETNLGLELRRLRAIFD